MMKLDTKYAFLKGDIAGYQDIVTKRHEDLHNKTGKGNDYVGQVGRPNNYNKEEYAGLKNVVADIREKCDVLMVCGIGGSYLGARAAVEMINGMYSDKKPEITFFGNIFSSTYIAQVMKYVRDRKVAVNVISKSGTTTETVLAFRLPKRFMEEKYGKKEAAKRIVVTTDKARGTLKTIADKGSYGTFVIPDDIGGRFSVTTLVGLLPIAVAGIDTNAITTGLKKAYENLKDSDSSKNDAYAYAVSRRVLKNQGRDVEMLVGYEIQMTMVAEWWKQLFGESEGKECKGNLPTNANFSADLHSLGQFVQDGKKVLYETLLLIDKPTLDLNFPEDAGNLDGMNYLAGKSVDWVNKMACQGTLEAHEETGGIPNLILTLDDMSTEGFGYMYYLFFKACAITCYMLDISPFNQPGIEVYKKNMFRLLGKKQDEQR